jgi:hypothetical protein
MAKSKRYKIAKKLVIDVLIKYEYFRKKEKKSYTIFLRNIFVQRGPSRSEKHYGERIANIILMSIAVETEKGRYYDKYEISDFIDLEIAKGILYNQTWDSIDQMEQKRQINRLSSQQQQINDVREAIDDFRRLDTPNLDTDSVYTHMVREKIKYIREDNNFTCIFLRD